MSEQTKTLNLGGPEVLEARVRLCVPCGMGDSPVKINGTWVHVYQRTGMSLPAIETCGADAYLQEAEVSRTENAQGDTSNLLLEQLQSVTWERDQARREVDRLRTLARKADGKTACIEFDGGTLTVTIPHGKEEDELALAQAFVEIYQGVQQMGKAEDAQ